MPTWQQWASKGWIAAEALPHRHLVYTVPVGVLAVHDLWVGQRQRTSCLWEAQWQGGRRWRITSQVTWSPLWRHRVRWFPTTAVQPWAFVCFSYCVPPKHFSDISKCSSLPLTFHGFVRFSCAYGLQEPTCRRMDSTN